MEKARIAKALQEATEFALTETEADRVIVVYEGIGKTRGFDLDSERVLEEGSLSLQMLQNFLQKREAVLVKEALADPDFQSRTSAVLSSLGSVLFVPIENESGLTRGFLYMDQVGRSTFLSAGFLERVKRYVKQVIEPKIHTKKTHLEWSELSSLEWLS